MEASISLPASYSLLPFKNISISHVPASSPTPSQVLLLKLNRPQKFNAVTERMIEELVTAYEYFHADDRVKAIVVTGTGKAFCVGADLEVGFSKLLNKLDGGSSNLTSYRDGGGRVTLAIHNCQKPTIMAINGPAAGFGITITLPATIRIACSSTKISFAFARRGLVMEAASSYFLPRLVGMSRALHLVTTGATYTASDPLLSQLFSELLPTPEETVARALAIATEITAQTSTVSTKVMRDMMYRGPSTAEEAHLLDSKIFLEMLQSKDSEEGMKSFMEKREPDFKGTMKEDAPLEWPWWKPLTVTRQESQEKRTNKL
ncbi:ClpP/crotonase-like domain-containing protein [Leptodontidium sp. MPI-SDFR-AT-0119]|nr:ClpP/crotonase-like domain-containing protein [Leptodontidium sp. MPI-SDFR-AT-0119]